MLFPSPRDTPNLEIESVSPETFALQVNSTAAPLGKLCDTAKAVLFYLAGVLTASVQGLFAIPSSSESRFVRTFHYDLSFLGSPEQPGSWLH